MAEFVMKHLYALWKNLRPGDRAELTIFTFAVLLSTANIVWLAVSDWRTADRITDLELRCDSLQTQIDFICE